MVAILGPTWTTTIFSRLAYLQCQLLVILRDLNITLTIAFQVVGEGGCICVQKILNWMRSVVSPKLFRIHEAGGLSQSVYR